MALLHKTSIREKILVKSENSGKHNFNINFPIGKKEKLKIIIKKNAITRELSGPKMLNSIERFHYTSLCYA